MKPAISGRRYWTIAARCSPKAPAMSRVKQATQKPMLPGLPNFTRKAAITPKTSPAIAGPFFDISRRSICFYLQLCSEYKIEKQRTKRTGGTAAHNTAAAASSRLQARGRTQKPAIRPSLTNKGGKYARARRGRRQTRYTSRYRQITSSGALSLPAENVRPHDYDSHKRRI